MHIRLKSSDGQSLEPCQMPGELYVASRTSVPLSFASPGQGHPMFPSINEERLWRTIMDVANIGSTPEGGSCRLALTPGDVAARDQLLQWCEPLGLRHEQD